MTNANNNSFVLLCKVHLFLYNHCQRHQITAIFYFIIKNYVIVYVFFCATANNSICN